jgi:hypothetical protein
VFRTFSYAHKRACAHVRKRVSVEAAATCCVQVKSTAAGTPSSEIGAEMQLNPPETERFINIFMELELCNSIPISRDSKALRSDAAARNV